MFFVFFSGNETYENSTERVKLEDDKESQIPNAILVIDSVDLSDRNEYTCYAKTKFSATYDAKSSTYVRVKGALKHKKKFEIH